MGIGRATGENRAVEAAKQAIYSPLLETTIEGSRGVLLNITGSSNLGLFEVNEAAELVAQAADPNANIIFGAVIDDNLPDEIRITVIATGFETKDKVKNKKIDKPMEMVFATRDKDKDDGPDLPSFIRNKRR